MACAKRRSKASPWSPHTCCSLAVILHRPWQELGGCSWRAIKGPFVPGKPPHTRRCSHLSIKEETKTRARNRAVAKRRNQENGVFFFDKELTSENRERGTCGYLMQFPLSLHPLKCQVGCVGSWGKSRHNPPYSQSGPCEVHLFFHHSEVASGCYHYHHHLHFSLSKLRPKPSQRLHQPGRRALAGLP